MNEAKEKKFFKPINTSSGSRFGVRMDEGTGEEEATRMEVVHYSEMAQSKKSLMMLKIWSKLTPEAG